ncbi:MULTISPECIES: TetR/AcrR family transcriptional regulator [Streptomyces]|uniref:TetR/AcrR family transcriptional regulator n=1 Tax=Streptomyces koelreuteriae TaxID=2838015 RepID=A0ABX8FXK3_9ACTN|nr:MULTISPECIES: TetR/AcrR family transcriptional regulator [Streptomyces]QWB25971.1 TetR/AcrR family transcriptional regulator [Streptomyces koelreuteriae]UUA09039.1 TetR/AcrR family transcriptional regulator [Streptomyces koelreuteriae]UUA16644.1 TetR/AcrR family transcriptional regulator [Streptomyces sp. CRCS-T-1]
MTKPVVREPLRRNSRSNRARILATARQELGRNPDVTLEEIARAAGVVRRTLFGHFPGRAALLEALAEEASETLRGIAAGVPDAEEAPERALARFVLSIWPVGDRYRLLLSLARQDLGTQRVSETLAPARDEATAILERGQRAGVFHDHLPAAVLSAALEAVTLSLLESVNTGAWEDDGTRTAVATLVAAGVSDEAATSIVRDVASEMRDGDASDS